MAAAERAGELELEPRLGLTSVLLLRERRADCDCERAPGRDGAVVVVEVVVVVEAVVEAAAVRWKLRAGEASRECTAEVEGEGEPDAFSERSLARDWRRIEGICVAGVPCCGACTTEAWLDVELSRVEAAVEGVGVVDEDVASSSSGSALSSAPVTLWNWSPSAAAAAAAAAVEVMFAAIRRLQLAGTLGAALSCLDSTAVRDQQVTEQWRSALK